MTTREDLIRESLELEAEFLEDLGEHEEAAKARARVPKPTSAAHARTRRVPGGHIEVAHSPTGDVDYVVMKNAGRWAAFEVKSGRIRGRRVGKAVPSGTPVRVSLEGLEEVEISIDDLLRIRESGEHPPAQLP